MNNFFTFLLLYFITILQLSAQNSSCNIVLDQQKNLVERVHPITPSELLGGYSFNKLLDNDLTYDTQFAEKNMALGVSDVVATLANIDFPILIKERYFSKKLRLGRLVV